MKSIKSFGLFVSEQQRWVLILLLVFLHLTLLADARSTFGFVLWLADVGLFMLWQPFVRAERRMTPGGMLILILGLGLGAWWFGHWLLIVWTGMLASLIGGRVMFIKHVPTRVFFLIAFAYLLSALLIWLMPKVVHDQSLIGLLLDREFAWGGAVLFAVMAVMPVSREAGRSHGGMVDFFYSVFILLLVAVLILGSLAFMLLSRSEYITAVFKTLFFIGVLLALIGWAWNPRAGFSGLGVFFSRYLLTMGLPFERWLAQLMRLSASENDPEKFLSLISEGLNGMPWVSGGIWVADAQRGEFGEASLFRETFANQPLVLTLFTHHKLSPTLLWHFHLLAKLTNEYYVAKRHARELEQMGYLKAVYETGSRLTHDVKNLLQSLNNLCYLVQLDTGQGNEQMSSVLQRQLPVITQRLQQTMEKLQQPVFEEGERLLAETWWHLIQERFAGTGVVFSQPQRWQYVDIPAHLFDSVAENLIQNALIKRQSEPDIEISVSLSAEPLRFAVCDTGSAVPAGLVGRLFKETVASENGLGVGLYHAARQAENLGFVLRLASNETGSVCFELGSVTRDASGTLAVQ